MTHSVPTACSGYGMGHIWVTKDIKFSENDISFSRNDEVLNNGLEECIFFLIQLVISLEDLFQ